MELLASIISSTLNAGTPLLIAAVGILIHEKSGVLNLGIEGIMLMGAVTGFGVTLSTGSFALGFAAGFGVGLLLGLLFAFFTIGIHANQYAAGLALTLFGTGLSAFIGQPMQGAALPSRAPLGIPFLEDVPFFGPAFFSLHAFVYIALILLALVWYFLFKTRGGLILRARLRRFHGGLGRCVPVACLHAALGGRHDGGPRLDRARARHVRHVASGARRLRGVSLRRRHDAAVRLPGDGDRRAAAVHGDDALPRDDSRSGAHLAQSRVDSPERPGFARETFPAEPLRSKRIAKRGAFGLPLSSEASKVSFLKGKRGLSPFYD